MDLNWLSTGNQPGSSASFDNYSLSGSQPLMDQPSSVWHRQLWHLKKDVQCGYNYHRMEKSSRVQHQGRENLGDGLGLWSGACP